MKRFLLAITSTLFLPTLGLAFLFLNITHTMLSPNIYKKALTDANAYERLSKININQLLSIFSKNKNLDIMQKVKIKVSKETLQKTVEPTIDFFFVDVLRNGKKTIIIDLSDFQKDFLGQYNIPIYLFPEGIIPQNYSIPIPGTILLFQPFIAILPILTYLFFALSFFYLFLIILFKKNNRGKLRLPAYLIFSLGLTYLIIYFVAWFLDPSKYISLGSQNFAQIALDVLNNLKVVFIRPYLIEGIILISISIIAFIISFFIPQEKNKLILPNKPIK
ncbi:MAG: hypothetical protein PHN19_01570 [Patescibacteria group bacterium]|nr:hypothetical protein [Patescibacteria group bacterium]